jgi:hypothetical protein
MDRTIGATAFFYSAPASVSQFAVQLHVIPATWRRERRLVGLRMTGGSYAAGASRPHGNSRE